MPEIIEHTKYNYAQWKSFDEQGIHTLNDIIAAAQHIQSYKKTVPSENQLSVEE